MYRNTYIEINLDNLKNNVSNIINKYNDYKYYIGVVKGNCYNHGYYAINTLVAAGVNYLAVSTLDEAIQIRKFNNNIPILCLEPISLEYLDICIKNKVTLTIPSFEYFKMLNVIKSKDNIKVHLKLDTGMNRLGIKDKNEIKEIFEIKNSKIIIEGIYTHFQTPGISDYIWDNQVKKFKKLISLIDIKKIPIIHMGRSLTLVNHKRIDICNGIRMGIIMYGFDHTPHYEKTFLNNLRMIKANMRIKKFHISETTTKCPIDLKECFGLYSEIFHIQHVLKGEYIGYGTAYQADQDLLVGIVPIGYADGFSRRNSGREVYINNKRYQIIGEIGMGMIFVIIDKNISLHDRVELIGPHISVREVAHYIRTTTYETMCMLDSAIPKKYIVENKVIYNERS